MRSLPMLFTAIAACLLTACASSAPPVKLEPVRPPANLVAPCPPPPDLPDDATMGDMLAVLVDMAGAYNDCAARHRMLSEWANPATR